MGSFGAEMHEPLSCGASSRDCLCRLFCRHAWCKFSSEFLVMCTCSTVSARHMQHDFDFIITMRSWSAKSSCVTEFKLVRSEIKLSSQLFIRTRSAAERSPLRNEPVMIGDIGNENFFFDRSSAGTWTVEKL